MTEADEIQKLLTDFLKGKGVSPDQTSAILSFTGENGIPDLETSPMSGNYRELAIEYPGVVAGLRRCALFPTLAILSAMLTLPELRGNSIRLEALAHFAIRYSRGKEIPTPAKIAAWFNQLDAGTCGRREDAAETLFIFNVTDNSNYLLFGSQDEGEAYFTQVFLDILASMPDAGQWGKFKRSCRSLLILSDMLVRRRELPRNLVGESVPQARIPQMTSETLAYLKEVTVFSYEELKEAGVNLDDLGPLTLTEDSVHEIDDSFFGHSPVEAAPLIAFPKGIMFTLPNAASIAVRRMIVEFCLHHGLKEAFDKTLVDATLACFRGEKLFGDLPRPQFFRQEKDGVTFSEIFIEADEGRYLHFLFLFDTLDGYDNGGFSGFNPTEKMGDIACERVESARTSHIDQPNFREGISVIVGCGWGRGMGFNTPEDFPEWHTETMGAFDLLTFSRLPDFTSLDLFRLIRARTEVTAAGIPIFYPGSLLNLYGWVEGLKGHIVRHEELKEEHFQDGYGMPMMIPTNCALKLRFDAAQGFDLHFGWAPDGKPAFLQRFTDSASVGEKSLSPIYVDVRGLPSGEFRGVYEHQAGEFWIDVTTSRQLDPRTRYQLNKLVLNWAEIIARRAFSRLKFKKPPHLMWRIEFQDDTIPETPPTAEELNAQISIHIDSAAPVDQPRILVEKGFLGFGRHPDNVAEKALVTQMIIAASTAIQTEGSEDGDDLASVLEDVISDPGARHFHAFALSDVRDFVRHELPEKAQVIEEMDDANGRLGMGWLARDRALGGVIEGLPECRVYLGELVSAIALRMDGHLKSLDRKEVVRALVLNHEAASAEMDLWQRTYKAVRALSSDPEEATKDITERISRLNMASLSSRIAAEIALCLCPLKDGLNPGKLDVAALMADAAELFQMGGFSDAMHAGMMEPVIHISSAGDVMMNHSFTDQIVQPMGEKFQAISLASAAKDYKSNYLPEDEELEVRPHPAHALDDQFSTAFEDEFGFTLLDVRAFGMAFSDMAAEQRLPILEFTRSALVEHLGTKTAVSPDILQKMISRYALTPRDKWQSAPEGILSNAWCPWRFKRQLSLLTRPLIQIDLSDDPTFLVAPAMVVHHLSHTLNSMQRAAFDKDHFHGTGKMYRYVGARNGTDGEAFNGLVAERVRECGWQAEANLTDGKILGGAKRPGFGDVDVLAWSIDQKRVIATECKDLGFDKTFGEIARRMAKFRGETRHDGKRDDLKKHLDRIEVLRANLTHMKAFIGFEPDEIESVVLTRQPGPLQVDQNMIDKGVNVIALSDLPQLLAFKPN